MTPTVNKKSFSISKITSKAFSIILDGFTHATSLFMSLRFKNPIQFNSSAIVKPSITYRLRRIRLSIISKLIVSQTQSFSLRKVRINFIVKEIKKFVVSLSTHKLNIAFNFRMIQKSSLPLVIKKVSINFSPTLATFFTLGYFDTNTLSTLDVLTLGGMDYV